MTSKNFWYTVVVVFALTCFWRWLASSWAPWIWNPASNWTPGWALWGLSFAWLWTWVFAKGYRNGGLWEGLRYGLILGALGTAFGVAIGGGMAWTLTTFDLIRFDPEVAAIYFISSVPFRLRLVDLAAIIGFSLAVTVLACWFPARKAVSLAPSDALRYE